MQSTQVCVWSPFSHSLSHLLFRSYALVEFKHSDDAKYALRKLDSQRIDGSKWLVDPANVKDFKYFDWTPSSSVSSPQSFFFTCFCCWEDCQRCYGAASDDISIRLSTTFAVCFCRLIHGTQLPWMSEASL